MSLWKSFAVDDEPTEEDKITATAETPRQAWMTEHRTESTETATTNEYKQGSNDNRKGNDESCESGGALVSLNKGTAGPEALAYSTKAASSKLDGNELVVLFCSNEV